MAIIVRSKPVSMIDQYGNLIIGSIDEVSITGLEHTVNIANVDIAEVYAPDWEPEIDFDR
jgi:hypothetical protein